MSAINESWNSVACCTTKPKNSGLFCDAAVTKSFHVREVAGYNNKKPVHSSDTRKETKEVSGGLTGRKCVKCNRKWQSLILLAKSTHKIVIFQTDSTWCRQMWGSPDNSKGRLKLNFLWEDIFWTNNQSMIGHHREWRAKTLSNSYWWCMKRDTTDKTLNEDVRKLNATTEDIFKQSLIDTFHKICEQKLKHKNVTRATHIKGLYLDAKNLTCMPLISRPKGFVLYILLSV